jgi:VanZ family protein
MPRFSWLIGKMIHSGNFTMRIFVIKGARIGAWILAIAIIVLSLVPPSLRPETDIPHNLEHFAIFIATGAAFGLGYSRRPGLVSVLLVVFAGVIEIAQFLVPGRHPRLSDFIVDALAACIGLAISTFFVARTLERSI